MAEEITIQECASLLKRLAHERRLLEKGAEIAIALASMDRVTKERQAVLTALEGEISTKDTTLKGIDQALRDKEFASTMHMTAVESEHNVNVGTLEKSKDNLLRKIAASEEAYNAQERTLTLAHNTLIETYAKEEQQLSSRITELRAELESLQHKAAVLSGV